MKIISLIVLSLLLSCNQKNINEIEQVKAKSKNEVRFKKATCDILSSTRSGKQVWKKSLLNKQYETRVKNAIVVIEDQKITFIFNISAHFSVSNECQKDLFNIVHNMIAPVIEDKKQQAFDDFFGDK